MKAQEILSERLRKELQEHATGGSTGAGNVATVVGGIGAGFDPEGHHGVYEKQKKKSKSTVIRR